MHGCAYVKGDAIAKRFVSRSVGWGRLIPSLCKAAAIAIAGVIVGVVDVCMYSEGVAHVLCSKPSSIFLRIFSAAARIFSKLF